MIGMKVLLTLHLITAIFVIGPAVGAAMSAPAALRSGNPGSVAILTRLVTIYGIGSLVVALLGLSMVRGKDSGWHIAFTDTWVYVSVILYVVALLVTVGLLLPALRQASSGAEGTPVAKPLVARISAGGGLIATLYIVIIVLMVYKPA